MKGYKLHNIHVNKAGKIQVIYNKIFISFDFVYIHGLILNNLYNYFYFATYYLTIAKFNVHIKRKNFIIVNVFMFKLEMPYLKCLYSSVNNFRLTLFDNSEAAIGAVLLKKESMY